MLHPTTPASRKSSPRAGLGQPPSLRLLDPESGGPAPSGWSAITGRPVRLPAPDGVDVAVGRLDAASAAAAEWARWSVAARAEVIVGLAAEAAVRAGRVALVRADEFGLPVSATVPLASTELCDHRVEAPVVVPGCAPGGVAAVLVAGNSALAGRVELALSTLAAGSACLILVPPEAARSAAVLMESARAVGLPSGLLSVVCVSGREVDALAGDPRVTGFRVTGRDRLTDRAELQRRTAGLPVDVEDPRPAAAVLGESAPVEAFLGALPPLCLGGNGQYLGVQSRVLVPAGRWDEIVPAVTAAVAALRLGDPRDPATMVGPMADEDRLDELAHHLGLAWRAGARVTVGGERGEDFAEGAYFEPTVVAAADGIPEVAHLRGPGPVVTLLRYAGGIEDAVRVVREAGWRAGSVWAKDQSVGDPVAAIAAARAASTGTRISNVA